MTSTGIQRKVDDLGRIVIPAGIRRSLNMREGDTIEVHVDGERVVLQKPQDACVFCESGDDLQLFRGRRVCRPCVGSVGVMDEQIRRTSREAPAAAPTAAPEPAPQQAAPPSAVPAWNIQPPAAPATPPPAAPAPEAAPEAAPAPTPAPAPAVTAPRQVPAPSRADEPASSTAW